MLLGITKIREIKISKPRLVISWSSAWPAAALLLVFFLSTALHGQLTAFSEAEGFGALASGGRGGQIYRVTNLNNSGPGSFRDAVSQPNRLVVFGVGGVINITSQIAFSNNITVAGQTAPGGIAVYGHGVSLSNRSNIIVRDMTFRAGINTSQTIKTVNMTNTHNVILDHVSIGWGRYDNFGITSNSSKITLQNSIVHEAINNQRAGGLIDSSRELTLVRNLFSNNDTRNPKGKADMQYVNNVIYNYGKGGYVGGHSSAPWHQDLIGNYFIAGPSQQGDYLTDFNSNDRVFIQGNKIDDNKNGALDGRNIDANKIQNVGGTVMPTAFNSPEVATRVMTAEQAVAWVAERAGNSRFRDSADARQVNHLNSLGTLGYIPANEGQVGGMPVWSGGMAPADSDNDSIPDYWEDARGLNKNVADSLIADPLGYHMLEAYVNGLSDRSHTVQWHGQSGNWLGSSNWQGGKLPTAFEHISISGSATVQAAVEVPILVASGLSLRIGDTSGTAGANLMVNGGRVEIADRTQVGVASSGNMTISSGHFSTRYLVLGNTTYSNGSATDFSGQVNLTGGVLETTQVALGGGTPGIWDRGGILNWSGGTIRAKGDLLVKAPLHVSGTGGQLDTNGRSATVSGTLLGSGTFSKTGIGSLNITRENSFNGAVRVNQGNLNLGHRLALGTGRIELNGGTVTLGSVSGISTPIEVISSGSLVSGGITMSGSITGNSLSSLRVVTSTPGNLTLGGSLTNFHGTLNFEESSGNIRLGSPNNVGSSQAAFHLGNQTASLRTSFGGVVQLGELSGGYSTSLRGATNNSDPVTYMVGGRNTNSRFNGVITDGLFTTPGSVSLVKVGTGTFTLGNSNNSYTGSTIVQQGTLIIMGRSASPVTEVHEFGTLAGSGIIGGDLIVHGQVSPGLDVGRLTVAGNVTFAAGSKLILEINPRLTYDQLAVQGFINFLEGSSLEIKFTPSLEYSEQTRKTLHLFQSKGMRGFIPSLVIPSLPSGWIFETEELRRSGRLDLVYSVPEPGTFCTLAVCILGLVNWRHRKE